MYIPIKTLSRAATILEAVLIAAGTALVTSIIDYSFRKFEKAEEEKEKLDKKKKPAKVKAKSK